MEQQQKEFEKLVAEYKKGQEGKITTFPLFKRKLIVLLESQKLIQNSSKLQTQLNENEMVKRELDLITDNSKVYKLIGSILVPQEIEEARTNVAKRLEYITGEECEICSLSLFFFLFSDF